MFAAFGPAAAAAGSGLLIALAVTAAVAYANATSSARPAAVHPESGGTYVYGRRRLGAVWGFSSFAVLVCHAIANTAALTLHRPGPLHRPGRRRARAVAVLGLAGCLTLAATLPPTSVLTGAVVLLFGPAGRALVHRFLHPAQGHRRRPTTTGRT